MLEKSNLIAPAGSLLVGLAIAAVVVTASNRVFQTPEEEQAATPRLTVTGSADGFVSDENPISIDPNLPIHMPVEGPEAVGEKPFTTADPTMSPRSPGPDSQDRNLVAEDEYVTGELLIKFLAKTGAVGIQNTAERVGARHLKTFPVIGVRHWRLGKGLSVEQALKILSEAPFKDSIEYVEPNYILHAHDFPSDPRLADLWGLHNIGQTGGLEDADVDALEAWQVQQGSASVVVGVIDTGIDYLHEDLAANIWINPDEDLNGNGIVDASDFDGVDNDGNGYVDDLRGWDFRNDDDDPMDDNGHGSHTAGTIGAVGDNGIGVTGLNWTVQLMPLKFLSSSGGGKTSDAIDAILYAASFEDSSGNKIVRITNNSWGGGQKSKSLENAFKGSGALVVASAGNSASSKKSYPAGFSLDNIISVAATDHNDALASFSNFSSAWVDLGAPGVAILSTILGDDYGKKNGTSMAAPHVAGAAALLLADDPNADNAALKSAILDNVDPITSLSGKTVTGGRLNIRASLGAPELPDDFVAPDAVTDLLGAGVTTDSISLSWTAVADDGSDPASGLAYLYDVRYDTVLITDTNWDTATRAEGEPLPQPVGLLESFTITGLTGDTTYFIALKVADEVGNFSLISNVVNATTDPDPVSQWTPEIVDAQDNVGFYKSLAFEFPGDGHPSIGYYDSTNEEAKFAHWNGTSWDIEVVGSGGLGIVLAYDSAGLPSLAYRDGGKKNKKLKFARFNGSTWDIENIDSFVGFDDIGLAYDSAGNPGISYRKSGLKFAQWDGSAWQVEVVDAGAKARYNSLAYDAGGNPAIAYSHDIDGNNTLDTLKFAHWNGTSWDIENVETGTSGFGVFARINYDPITGDPVIVHRASGSVRYVRWNGTSWEPAEIVDTGSYCSFTFDSSGTAYVSYRDGGQVRVAKRLGVDVYEIEVVDEGSFSWRVSVAVDPDDMNELPSVAYQESIDDDLKYARRNP